MRKFIYTPPIRLPTLIFENARYLAINKPSGLLSNPGIDPKTHDCALSRLQSAFGEVYLVHRLDCDTSGVLVFAKTKKAEGALKKQLQERQVKKTYEALVWGIPQPASGVIAIPIAANPQDIPLQHVSTKGKEAITHYQTLPTHSNTYSRVILNPQTGRTHQLRVHLNHIGHPILGDTFYGHAQAQAAQPRLCLHATKMVFNDVDLRSEITLEIPADF